jgi:integrase
MSTSESPNRFKFTESSVQKRCLSAGQEDDVVVGGTLYERRFWDTELRGFGIIARPKTASFVFQRDLHGKSVKVTIGRVGVWTVAMARARARELAVDMDRGINPNVVKRQAKARGITVKQALELHAADMKKRGCAQSSIKLVEKELPMYLPDWIRRPLAELSKLECVQRHAKLSLDRGPMIANKVLKMIGAAFRGAARVYDHLPELPPTRAIRWNHGPRRRSPLAWDDLPAWWDKVQAMHNPIRRDLQLLLLFTGLRSTDAKTIRWEHVDRVRKTLHRPKPKGGVDRAFTIPLAEFVLEILRRRRRENDVLFPGSEWVFPARSRSGTVAHVAEAKELRGIVKPDLG